MMILILISADQWGRAWLPFEGERSTSWPSEELLRLPPIWHNNDDGEEDDDDDGDESTTNLTQWSWWWKHHQSETMISSSQFFCSVAKFKSAHFSVLLFCHRMFCNSASADPNASFAVVYLLFWSLPEDGSFVVNVRLNFEYNDFTYLSGNVTFNVSRFVNSLSQISPINLASSEAFLSLSCPCHFFSSFFYPLKQFLFPYIGLE